jgi:hypothetical protein
MYKFQSFTHQEVFPQLTCIIPHIQGIEMKYNTISDSIVVKKVLGLFGNL